MIDLSTALGRVKNALASNLGADSVLVLTKVDVAELLALIEKRPPLDYGSLDAVQRLAVCRGDVVVPKSECPACLGDAMFGCAACTPEPVAAAPIQEDRETLIGYGRSSGLEEASTLCTRLAYAAYYPPGTRFKAFTPKAQKALGDLLIKAANEIASLPGGPYERFKARQAKKAESAKSRQEYIRTPPAKPVNPPPSKSAAIVLLLKVRELSRE